MTGCSMAAGMVAGIGSQELTPWTESTNQKQWMTSRLRPQALKAGSQ